MKIVGVIPARYASTRFPGKPLADICGKPMIWWVYNQAKKVKELDEVYVATDDDRIKNVCEEFNMNVVMTSTEHQTGTDRLGEVASKIDADIYVNIQGDEPIIPPEMISELVKMFDDKQIYYATLKRKVKDVSELKSKTVVKVVTDRYDNAILFSRQAIPYSINEDDFSKHFAHIGLYGYSKSFLLEFIKLPVGFIEALESVEPIRALENGYKICINETNYSSISVDLPEHIKLIEDAINGGILNV